MSYNLDSIIDSFEMIEIFKNLSFHSKEKTELDVPFSAHTDHLYIKWMYNEWKSSFSVLSSSSKDKALKVYDRLNEDTIYT